MRIPMQFQALENSVWMETYEFLELGKYCVSLQSHTQVAKPRHLYLSLMSSYLVTSTDIQFNQNY